MSKISVSIDELVKYLSDLADINEMEKTTIMAAISNQFKEIKRVNTAVNLNLEEEVDEEQLRASIQTDSLAAMKRTKSKMYGPSIQKLAFESDFEDLCALWSEKMEEHKLMAD